MNQPRSAADILAFWNSRTQLGAHAGTQDLIAKELEIGALAKHIHDGTRVLDAGCGNGITSMELARRYDIDLIGVDYAETMINEARAIAPQESLRGRVSYQVADLRALPETLGAFDIVYTERALINLASWEEQAGAIASLVRQLVPSGCYLMCENSQDGLDRINDLRRAVGLPVITPPWHNRYFRDTEIASTKIPGAVLERVEDFSSTYYFLSRVVNAWLAAGEGRAPQYDAPLNRLALELPPIGSVGQGRLWVWRKESA